MPRKVNVNKQNKTKNSAPFTLKFVAGRILLYVSSLCFGQLRHGKEEGRNAW